jgi:DNA segregation ATPase FtsK/SpoIIIE, S-DNA-T family
MKWLKKQFNKIFLAVDEDDIELEQWEIEEQEANNQQQNTQQPKKKFVFPVVEDHEQFDKKPTTYNETNHIVDGKLTLPTHIKQDGGISKVYDIEVSGIRELLERRKSSSGRKITHPEQIQTPPKRPTFKEQPVAYREKEKAEEMSSEISLEKRKKFVPTKVPSPVYGFSSPQKKGESIIHSGKTFDQVQQENDGNLINEIVREENVQLPHDYLNITEQNELHTSNAHHEHVMDVNINENNVNIEINETHTFEQENKTLNEQSPFDPNSVVKFDGLHDNMVTVEKSNLNSEQEKLDKTVEIQIENMSLTSVNPDFEEEQNNEINQVKEVLEQSTLIGQVEQEDVDTIQTDKVTFHNSTVHIENLNISDVQTVPVAEQIVENRQDVVEQPTENLQLAQPDNEDQPVIKTRSKLPFNVLMLKSDKEKLAAKQKNEQIIENSFVPYSASATVESNVDTHRTIPKQYIQAITSQEKMDELNGMMGITEFVEKDESEHIIEILETAHDVIEYTDTNSEALYKNNLEEMKEVDKVDSLEQAIASTELINQTVDNELVDTREVEQTVQAEQQIQEINEEVIEVVDSKVETEQQLAMPLTKELLNEPLPYTKPPHSILAPPEEMLEDTEWMEEQGEHLVEALSHFQVQAQVESVVQGPAVTQFEITVGHGTKVSKVRNLSDDIQLALAARDIRIDAPIPGKRSIGIEIPNRVSRPVRLSEVTNSERFQKSDSPLEAALGLDLNGNPVTLDLRKMPHGLIAGATGSGKSVCINSILVSLLYKSAPHELKLMLIDPKMVELAPFNHIPHLVSPVITDVKAATESLKWAVDEMERRYQLFMHSGTRDITRYNKLCEENKMYAQKLPYLLIVIDELADLMMMSPADVELAISRLAQKARACGIHLILATQRPSVDVITGTLKSNIPTRIAFAVSSQIDSRTIIDQQGAERLLGRGDMLYLGNGMNAPQRIQGTFVTDEEIEEVVEYVRSQGEPNYFFKSEELVQKSETIEEQDELFEEVCRFVFSQGSASTSALQRRYHIGYNRAARLIDMLESQGFISEQKGSKPRDVYITETILEDMFS